MTETGENPKDLKRALFAVSDGVLGAGVLVFLGVWGGNWLDAKLGTAPWLSLGLSVLGAGVGLWRLIAKVTAIKFSTTTSTRAPKNQTTSSKTSTPGGSEFGGAKSQWDKWESDSDD